MEGLGFNLGYLVVQIVSFLVMLIILRAWVYKPVLNMLDNRRKRIAQGLEDARVAEEARANAEKEADEILAKAQQEAAERLREAAERAEQSAREIKTYAERDAAEIRQAAALEAEHAQERALGELRDQVAALAIAAAHTLIGETLDEKRQRALIEDFFSGVKGGRVVLLEGASLSGASAEVTSALPLTESEQETVRKEIVEKIGSGANISFRVDPKILGGLIIRVGDRVLDSSVSGKLQGLKQSLR